MVVDGIINGVVGRSIGRREDDIVLLLLFEAKSEFNISYDVLNQFGVGFGMFMFMIEEAVFALLLDDASKFNC